ncbi:hypothetical protein D3C78_1488740 [compost metagenome]
MFISRFLVNHVALQHARHNVAGFHHRLIAAGLLVERFVQFLPQMYREIGVAIGNRHHHGGVLGFLGRLNVVAQLLESRHCNFSAESLFGD